MEGDGRSARPAAGLELILPDWFYAGVLDEALVLTIDRAYFELTGGLERWLYRLVRKHGGRQQGGWSFDLNHLHAKSGSLSPLKHFAYDLREIVRRETSARLSARHRARSARCRAPQLHAHSCRSAGGCSTPSWPRNRIGDKPVNHLVLSGTATHVLSGTRSSCYRGPKSGERFWRSTSFRARNFTNPVNLTSCCEPAGCEQVDWCDHRTSRFRCLTNTPIRQYDFVFGDTRMHAGVRASARLDHNQHRTFSATRRAAQSRRGTPNPSDSF